MKNENILKYISLPHKRFSSFDNYNLMTFKKEIIENDKLEKNKINEESKKLIMENFLNKSKDKLCVSCSYFKKKTFRKIKKKQDFNISEYLPKSKESSFISKTINEQQKISNFQNNKIIENKNIEQPIISRFKKIINVDDLFEENKMITSEINKLLRDKRNSKIRNLLSQKKSPVKKYYVEKSYLNNFQKKDINYNETMSNFKKNFFKIYNKRNSQTFNDFTEENTNNNNNNNVSLNQLTISAITSHKWRNQAKRFRILKMTPEFEIEKEKIPSPFCHKTRKKTISITKNKEGNLKDRVYLDTNLSINQYHNIAKDINKNNEFIYGMKNSDYEEVIKWCNMDKISTDNPNVEDAFINVSYINNERRKIKIRNKAKTLHNKKIEEILNYSPNNWMENSEKEPVFQAKRKENKCTGIKLRENRLKQSNENDYVNYSRISPSFYTIRDSKISHNRSIIQ